MSQRLRIKVGSLFFAVAIFTTSCSSSDPQATLPELIERVCKVMETIGYDYTQSAIDGLGEDVQRQLLSDIAEIEKLSPSRLDVSLESLCN